MSCGSYGSGGRGSTSNLAPEVDDLVCSHRVRPDLLTSYTDTNPARRYHRCIHRNTAKDCNFFLWHDAELPPFQKGCFLKLKNQKLLLEEQLKYKDIAEKQLNEKLEMKNNKLLLLEEQLKYKDIAEKRLNEKLEMKKNKLKKKIEELERKLKLERKFVMVLLICVFLAVFRINRIFPNGSLMLN